MTTREIVVTNFWQGDLGGARQGSKGFSCINHLILTVKLCFGTIHMSVSQMRSKWSTNRLNYLPGVTQLTSGHFGFQTGQPGSTAGFLINIQ